MKYLYLPIHLIIVSLLVMLHIIEFWYPEGLAFFLLTWKNLMLFLEEDLAVFLMWRLLFVPLFHDSSYVGRILSFFFRFGRILIGLFAFSLASLVLLAIATYWFSLPILAILDLPAIFSRALFLPSLGLFILHITSHPHKKIWSVHTNQLDDIWQTSEIKDSDLSFKKMLSTFEVADLLSNLEIQLNGFPPFEIINKEQVVRDAFDLAKKCGSQYIGPRHFFVAALLQVPKIDEFLLKLELSPNDFATVLYFLEKKKQVWRKVWIWDEDFAVHHLKGVNRGWLGVPTPNLNLVGEDLTGSVLSLNDAKFVRSDSVVSEIVNILSQPTGRNIILVGAPGSGKSALIRHLAKMIVAGDAPGALATKRLVMLDLSKLMANMSNEGELAERIKLIFDEVQFAQNVIIVIEEIHELGMGEAGINLNLYSLIQPYLESDACQFIGTTEPDNYAKVVEKNGTFARIFRKIEMPPATDQETLDILEYRSIEIERHLEVKVTFIALKEAISLSKRFIRDKVLPDSAISVLKEATAEVKGGWLTKSIIKQVVSSRVKVPLMEIGTADKAKLLNLESAIHSRMVDQEQAVKLVADTLRRSVAGFREEDRPIGSFLFVGPTGVGKTELAKTLAEVFFKTQGAFIRFDMSEFQNQESISRLIGQSGEGGFLTEAVRQRPYALLLLDEFEKANEKILTLFLQVFDEGRLTDGAGRIIDFSNTIIIKKISSQLAAGLDGQLG